MSGCAKEDWSERLWDLLTVGRVAGILHDGYDECHFTSEELREVSVFLFAGADQILGMWRVVVEWGRRRLAEELGHAMREAFEEEIDETEDTDTCGCIGDVGTALRPLGSSTGA